jgi:hypothetical protein
VREDELRARLGDAAKRLVREQFDVRALSSQLERLCISLGDQGRVPDEWCPSPEAVEAFASEYERRSPLEYRPLRRAERLQAELARRRELLAELRDVARAYLSRRA